MVTDFFIAKPAGTGTGSATFRAAINKQDGTAIVAGTAHQEEDAHYERGTVDVYSPIQAAPNNFIRIYGLNGSAANVTQSKDGTCVVGYIMPTKTYTGTVP